MYNVIFKKLCLYNLSFIIILVSFCFNKVLVCGIFCLINIFLLDIYNMYLINVKLYL